MRTQYSTPSSTPHPTTLMMWLMEGATLYSVHDVDMAFDSNNSRPRHLFGKRCCLARCGVRAQVCAQGCVPCSVMQRQHTCVDAASIFVQPASGFDHARNRTACIHTSPCSRPPAALLRRPASAARCARHTLSRATASSSGGSSGRARAHARRSHASSRLDHTRDHAP